MPYDFDETNPTDDYLIPSYPANERSHRDAVYSSLEEEHDTATGHHKIGIGDDTARNAITDWVVGSLWLNNSLGAVYWQRVVSVGPVVWQDVDARPGVAHFDENTNYTASQWSTPVSIAPAAGAISIISTLGPDRYATVPASAVLTISNPSGALFGAVTTICLELTNAGTGSSLAWGTSYVFPNGIEPPFDAASGAVNVYYLKRLQSGNWLVTGLSGIA